MCSPCSAALFANVVVRIQVSRKCLAFGSLLTPTNLILSLHRYSVENVPSVVAVSLKRFDEQLLKIESQVDFPSQLNLHKYIICKCQIAASLLYELGRY